MHNKTLIGLGLILFIVSTLVVGQSKEEQDRAQEAPELKSGNPEYSHRSLPADTFKPSEEISEDYPVPFPVDI
jgi:hypothetical protein